MFLLSAYTVNRTRLFFIKSISFILIFCIFFFRRSSAQSEIKFTQNQYGFQFGFSVNATLELALRHGKPNPNFRAAANAGVASNFLGKWMHPAFNVELQFYNGGLGSGNDNSFFKSKPCLDLIAAVTATSGFPNKNKTGGSNSTNRNAPLYYFSNFALPSLQNPYNYSLSLGTNIIFSTDKHKAFQRVGFLNLHFNRFQVSYYNDGGFLMADLHLGDGKDRYYTGGVTFSYNNPTNTFGETTELAFHKYTGYTKNAFELSNKLNLAYVYYHKKEQTKYNRSLWALRLANPSRGYGLTISSYNNVEQDVQHWIHWGIANAYHIVTYKPYWTVSGTYFGRYNKTGLW